ncbi:hypothetical protein H4219_002379 [Mycoemilia scoparia]|uniref:Vezatin n=1 Tax=Mycoemilia scoparia TaxID=417184 RepID=A0A9W8A196_9FUNG|nr:hypothetical protein H4219_002379 [Mycoemilia scoparia]
MAIGQVLEVAEEFLGTSTATEASDSLPGDSNISVSSLKDEFELYYRLRRCWLLFETDIALISMHDPNLYTTWSKHFAISLGLAMSKICQIEKEIEAHKQSSYSLNSSAGNDEKDTKKEHGQSKIPIPALNSLSSLLYSIRTIQAKVSLCQSYASNMFENFHSASSTQESDIDVRKLSEYELYKQLFQSMKSDIDMLHEQFDAGSCQLNLEIWPPVSSSRQDVLTASASQPDNAKNDESLNEDDSTLDGPYDQETDEFTLDAPELFFEASVVVKGRTRSSKNKEREKAKQLFRMMDELQDVVSARKKRPESEEMPSNENAEPNS